VTAYAPGLGIGEPIDRADGWNLVAGVPLHRPRSVPPYVPDIMARFPGIRQILRKGHTYFAVQLGFAAFPCSVATASASPRKAAAV
jgi:hypothetical protein